MIVYGLSSSEDGIVRYIGQTRNSAPARLKAHIQESFRKDHPKTYKCFWIRKVIEEGHQVLISTLVGKAIHNTDEKLLIAAYRALGFDLVNSTEGGDNSFDLSAEARKKMSDRRKGKKLSEETKAKLKKARATRVFSVTTREKLRKAKTKRPVPESTRQKISETLKGKKFSEERKKATSKAVKAWWNEKKKKENFLS